MILKLSFVLVLVAISNAMILPVSIPLIQRQANQPDKHNEENRFNSQSQFLRKPTIDESSIRQNQFKIPIDFVFQETSKNPIQIQRPVIPHELKQKLPQITQFPQFTHNFQQPQGKSTFPENQDFIKIFNPIDSSQIQVEKQPEAIKENDSKDKCSKERIAHPTNSNKYIVCLGDQIRVEMDCPDKLVFNENLDRCDYSTDKTSFPCDSNPCLFDGECINSIDDDYECKCIIGYDGKNCQVKVKDPCENRPCGTNGVCHRLPTGFSTDYFCTCFDDLMFGLECPDKIEINPCVLLSSGRELFETKISKSLFVHCDGQLFNLKMCPKSLKFSESLQRCVADHS